MNHFFCKISKVLKFTLNIVSNTDILHIYIRYNIWANRFVKFIAAKPYYESWDLSLSLLVNTKNHNIKKVVNFVKKGVQKVVQIHSVPQGRRWLSHYLSEDRRWLSLELLVSGYRIFELSRYFFGRSKKMAEIVAYTPVEPSKYIPLRFFWPKIQTPKIKISMLDITIWSEPKIVKR